MQNYLKENAEEKIYELLKKDKVDLNMLPLELINLDICKVALFSGCSMDCIPFKMINEDLCLFAMKMNPKLFTKIPTHLENYARLSEIYVRRINPSFRNYPKQLITSEMCIEAIDKDPSQIKYVPRELLTQEMYTTAACALGVDVGVIIDEMWITADLLKEHVKNHSLESIPEAMRTKDLCLTAVKRSGCELEFVPKNADFAELSLIAVKQNILAIKYV